MDALVKRYITDGAMDKYGQIEGFFAPQTCGRDGDTAGLAVRLRGDWSLGTIAERGNAKR